MTRRRWTEAEDAILRAYYGWGRLAEVRSRLATLGCERSATAIKQRARDIGLAERRPVSRLDWTPGHVALLRQLYGIVPTAEIARQLGGTVCAVRKHAERLGVASAAQPAERTLALESRLRQLRLMLAAQRGLITLDAAARAAGLTTDQFARRVAIEAGRGAMEATS